MKKYLFMLSGVVAIILAVLYLTYTEPQSHSAAIQSPAMPQGYFAQKPGQRLLYSLSVLRGGVATVGEFNMRASQDPALKSQVCPEATGSVVPSDIVVFTTFRRNNTIKWNRKPIVVKKGERLITGCGRTILMRCGNEISFVPRTPSEELPPGTLETPVANIPTPATTPTPSEEVGPPDTSNGGTVTTNEEVPPVFIVGGGFYGGGGAPGAGGPSGEGGGTTPPTAVSEPTTPLLICSGAFIITLVAYFGSYKKRSQ